VIDAGPSQERSAHRIGADQTRAVANVLHLSDLHLLGEPHEQDAILSCLIAALERERVRRGRPFDLVVITGDVFDSATLTPSVAVREFTALHRCIQHALGGRVPTVVIPGNHDRRRIGLFGPHRPGLFEALRAGLGDEVWVHGCEAPFLSRVIPPSFHKLPLWLVAYDSTYLPTGYLSAGGIVRQEDLLQAAAQIGEHEPGWPVLFLLHHHLVPTPLTDLGPIETHRIPPLAHAMLHRILPVLVSHADREELTMTALGAGTALSTLHTMNRATLVLHGHKHVASARKLEAPEEDQGDVLLVGAGSAGTAQRWNPTSAKDTARLWPSFNVVELEGDALTVEAVSFGWKGRSAGELAYRPLVWAAREGARFRLEPVRRSPSSQGPTLRSNESRITLLASPRFGGHRWDYECERRIEANGHAPRRYVETIEGIPGSVLRPLGPRGGAALDTPAQIELDFGRDAATRFRVEGGVCRTYQEAARLFGPTASPFDWVGLMNRYQSGHTRLVVEGLGPRASAAFASATDLGTGLERPVRCLREAGSDRVVVEVDGCPPRTLLRLYWSLDGHLA
jgi:3',5'-cyclic AMP phosphodiesterase CpdA